MSVCQMDDSPWCFAGSCEFCDAARKSLKKGTSESAKMAAWQKWQAKARAEFEEYWAKYGSLHE